MSKTDKDRPFWVQNLEHGRIDHDHRNGVCIISDDQRDRWPAWRHHWALCAKRVKVEYTCTKAEPHHDRMGGQTCWTLKKVAGDTIGYLRWEWVQCIGHTRTEFHDEIPCSCDDKPEPATCTPSWVYGRCWSGGVPSDFVRRYYHRPERARERGLQELVREYNAYGDLEDGDFVNRQARNSCRWLYW